MVAPAPPRFVSDITGEGSFSIVFNTRSGMFAASSVRGITCLLLILGRQRISRWRKSREQFCALLRGAGVAAVAIGGFAGA